MSRKTAAAATVIVPLLAKPAALLTVRFWLIWKSPPAAFTWLAPARLIEVGASMVTVARFWFAISALMVRLPPDWPLPVGLGFPGLTYVSDKILHLPFMQGRSLAHEIAHNWWGNAVENIEKDPCPTTATE